MSKMTPERAAAKRIADWFGKHHGGKKSCNGCVHFIQRELAAYRVEAEKVLTQVVHCQGGRVRLLSRHRATFEPETSLEIIFDKPTGDLVLLSKPPKRPAVKAAS